MEATKQQVAKILTRRDLAKELRVSMPTIDAQVKEGMPHMKVGKQYLFDYVDVITWLKSKTKTIEN